MAAKKKSRDGLTQLKSDTHQKKYLARLVGYDPVTKRKIVDTERVIYADDKADAMRQRKALIDAAVEAKIGASMGGGKLRFREASEQFLKTVTRKATRTVWTSYLKRAGRDFGERWLHKLTTSELERWLERQQGAKPTIDGIRMALVNLFAWGIKHGHATRPNVAAATVLERKRHTSDVAAKLAELEEPKKLALDEEELGLYLEAHQRLYPHTYPLVYTMLSLGTRYSEVSTLKRRDVDWRTGKVTIRRAHVDGELGPPKADKARFAGLAPSCLELLRGHVAASEESEWLFPRPRVWYGKANGLGVWSYDTIRAHIKASMADAGVYTDNASHFARHTIKGLLEGELKASVLQKVLGHASAKIHGRYGDANVVAFAQAVEAKGISPKARKPARDGK